MTNFANREVCDLIITDFKTGKPVLRVDYANTNTTEMTGEAVYAYGGKGRPKRIAFNGSREATFSFETQLQSFELYSLITGAAIETSAQFLKREVLTATSSGLTLSETPVAGTVNVFAEEDDCGTPLEISVTQKDVTGDNLTSGDKYIAYYQTVLTGVKKLGIKSTTFPKACAIYADTYEKSEDEEILPYKMVVYKAAPQANLTFSNSNEGDPATLTVTFDVLADENDNMIDLILQEEED